jgi:hypothetical protein
MVVDMRFSAMLLLDVPVWDVYVLDACVVVIVAVSGEEVSPVLASMQVVRHVEVLVTVLDGLVAMTSHLRHQLPPVGRAGYWDRTSLRRDEPNRGCAPARVRFTLPPEK